MAAELYPNPPRFDVLLAPQVSSMPYTHYECRCPRCDKSLDDHLGIFSGLGPPLLACKGCGKRIESGRLEWEEMTPLQKGWFVAYSIAAGTLAAGFWTFLTYLCCGLAYTRKEAIDPPHPLLAFAIWAVGFSLLMTMQWYRVVCSIRRTRRKKQKAFPAGWLDLQVSVLSKTSLVLFLSVALITLVGWLIGLLT